MIGVVISRAIFFGIRYATEMIYGFVAIGCGMLSAGLAALGFKIGKGNFRSNKDVTLYLTLLTGFGLLGVISGYFAPYFYYSIQFGVFGNIGLYFELIELNFIDAIFGLIGAYGGRAIGKNMVKSTLIKKMHTQTAQRT